MNDETGYCVPADTDRSCLLSTRCATPNDGGVLRLGRREERAPTVLANCLTRPSSMVFDENSGTLYVTEIGGRLVALSIGS